MLIRIHCTLQLLDLDLPQRWVLRRLVVQSLVAHCLMALEVNQRRVSALEHLPLRPKVSHLISSALLDLLVQLIVNRGGPMHRRVACATHQLHVAFLGRIASPFGLRNVIRKLKKRLGLHPVAGHVATHKLQLRLVPHISIRELLFEALVHARLVNVAPLDRVVRSRIVREIYGASVSWRHHRMIGRIDLHAIK